MAIITSSKILSIYLRLKQISNFRHRPNSISFFRYKHKRKHKSRNRMTISTKHMMKTGCSDPLICRQAVETAKQVVHEMNKSSRLIKPNLEKEIPQYFSDEIVLGRLLGSGAFNDVFSLQSMNPRTEENDDDELTVESSTQGRDLSTRGPVFAVKMLQPEIMETGEEYCQGAADLVTETKILVNLEPHPNIIRLHGMSAGGVSAFAQGNVGAYFLILDRLHETLDDRIKSWKLRKITMAHRAHKALELCNALKHLHKSNVIFRDLKPDNIGFDFHGTLKLFDFGLAKELNPRDLLASDNYDMTGNVGTRRYMAPEVVLGKPYSLSADVYSFGLILWQFFSLKEPFSSMDKFQHRTFVVDGNERPSINPEWPVKLANIMKWCWAHDSKIRPSMRQIHGALLRQTLKTMQQASNQNTDSLVYNRSKRSKQVAATTITDSSLSSVMGFNKSKSAKAFATSKTGCPSDLDIDRLSFPKKQQQNHQNRATENPKKVVLSSLLNPLRKGTKNTNDNKVLSKALAEAVNIETKDQ